MSYDIQGLERRYEGLEEWERTGLEMYFDDIIDYLEDSDRDWIKKGHIAEEHGLTEYRFASAYSGFIGLFEPSVGTGGAFAFYEMDYEEIVEAGKELELIDDREFIDPEDEFNADDLVI